MTLYICQECSNYWLTQENETCKCCGVKIPGFEECPSCGSKLWNRVDIGEELFILLKNGLSPARALYFYLNKIHGLNFKDIAKLCGKTETSVYNVINKAEEVVENE